MAQPLPLVGDWKNALCSKGHKLVPIGLFLRTCPGAICEECRQWQTLNKREFRTLFRQPWHKFQKQLRDQVMEGHGTFAMTGYRTRSGRSVVKFL